jgi:predicted NAD-dependent protein-ADP-ribosyltransferase YbiA (DUF1768 family)
MSQEENVIYIKSSNDEYIGKLNNNYHSTINFGKGDSKQAKFSTSIKWNSVTNYIYGNMFTSYVYRIMFSNLPTFIKDTGRDKQGNEGKTLFEYFQNVVIDQDISQITTALEKIIPIFFDTQELQINGGYFGKKKGGEEGKKEGKEEERKKEETWKEILLKSGDNNLVYESDSFLLGKDSLKNKKGLNLYGQALWQYKFNLGNSIKKEKALTREEDENKLKWEIYMSYSALKDRLMSGKDIIEFKDKSYAEIIEILNPKKRYDILHVIELFKTHENNKQMEKTTRKEYGSPLEELVYDTYKSDVEPSQTSAAGHSAYEKKEKKEKKRKQKYFVQLIRKMFIEQAKVKQDRIKKDLCWETFIMQFFLLNFKHERKYSMLTSLDFFNLDEKGFHQNTKQINFFLESFYESQAFTSENISNLKNRVYDLYNNNSLYEFYTIKINSVLKEYPEITNKDIAEALSFEVPNQNNYIPDIIVTLENDYKEFNNSLKMANSVVPVFKGSEKTAREKEDWMVEKSGYLDIPIRGIKGDSKFNSDIAAAVLLGRQRKEIVKELEKKKIEKDDLSPYEIQVLEEQKEELEKLKKLEQELNIPGYAEVPEQQFATAKATNEEGIEIMKKQEERKAQLKEIREKIKNLSVYDKSVLQYEQEKLKQIQEEVKKTGRKDYAMGGLTDVIEEKDKEKEPDFLGELFRIQKENENEEYKREEDKDIPLVDREDKDLSPEEFMEKLEKLKKGYWENGKWIEPKDIIKRLKAKRNLKEYEKYIIQLQKSGNKEEIKEYSEIYNNYLLKPYERDIMNEQKQEKIRIEDAKKYMDNYYNYLLQDTINDPRGRRIKRKTDYIKKKNPLVPTNTDIIANYQDLYFPSISHFLYAYLISKLFDIKYLNSPQEIGLEKAHSFIMINADLSDYNIVVKKTEETDLDVKNKKNYISFKDLHFIYGKIRNISFTKFMQRNAIEAINKKFESPEFAKVLLSTGSFELRYMDKNPVLGITKEGTGVNFVGRYLMYLRNFHYEQNVELSQISVGDMFNIEGDEFMQQWVKRKTEYFISIINIFLEYLKDKYQIEQNMLGNDLIDMIINLYEPMTASISLPMGNIPVPNFYLEIWKEVQFKYNLTEKNIPAFWKKISVVLYNMKQKIKKKKVIGEPEKTLQKYVIEEKEQESRDLECIGSFSYDKWTNCIISAIFRILESIIKLDKYLEFREEITEKEIYLATSIIIRDSGYLGKVDFDRTILLKNTSDREIEFISEMFYDVNIATGTPDIQVYIMMAVNLIKNFDLEEPEKRRRINRFTKEKTFDANVLLKF